MKKSTGSILLLSAFAAMVLAGCNNGGDSSSTPETGSSDTAVQTSADETSAPEGTSEAGTSAAGTSAAGTSAAGTSTASSSAAASSAASSSSTPAVETDWSQKSFIGEYKGGMSNLIINTDKTTSWGTSTDKFPATYTDLGGGLYKIQSASTVDDEDYVEVITDGTMAYVLHDKDAMDYYVMDKAALGSAVIAFCETADEENFFGGIEVSANHWKYFACIGGTYHFNVTITIQAGTNINASGAIFDYGTGANKTSWKVTRGAVAATSFATITQTNFNLTDYVAAPGTDGHGTLTIGTDSDGLVFATLNGVALDGATLSADGKTLSVPNGSAATGLDKTDPAGPMLVTPTTTYTLSTIAQTYTEGEGTTKVPLFPTITGDSGNYNAETDGSGSVWVVYVATESGVLDIDETVNNLYDSYIMVFDSTADNYTSTSLALDTDDNLYAPVSASVVVTAGHTYVIKLGAYSDKEKNYTATNSTYADTEEEFEWTFTAFTHDVYTGDNGDLDLMMNGNTLMSITLNGAPLGDYVKSNNTITVINKTIDTTNPTDISFTTTTTTITIDPTAKTYTSSSSDVVEHPFSSITESDTSFSGVTGNDGSIWVTFTPTASGSITVKETTKGVSDSYLQIFEYDPATGLSGLTSSGAKRLGYDDANPATVTVTVQAGVTYIIKLGAYASRDTLIGSTASSTSNIGAAEAFSFSYVDYLMQTFTGAEGDLVIGTKDGEYRMATLAGAVLEGPAEYDDTASTLTFYGAGTTDTTTNPDIPTRSSTDTVFTLDTANGTYTKSAQTNVREIITALDENSTGYSQFATEDGNIWASFTPSVDGYITIDETVKCDDYTDLAVYEKLATSTLNSYKSYSSSYTGQVSLAYNPVAPATSLSYSGTDMLYVHDLRVQAGHTYIIKLGTSGGDSKTIGETVYSSYSDAVGQIEAFTFSFVAENVLTYTGDNGNLTFTLAGDKLLGTKLGTTTVKGTLESEGKVYRVRGTNPTINNADPLDPVATYTTTLYYLDSEGMTYEVDTETEDVHMFQTLQPTDTSFTGYVGADGNLWGIFTAPEDGRITVEETETTSSDGYMQIFESTATSFTSTYAAASDDDSASIHWGGKISNFNVQAGHTYIIKGGARADKDLVVGGTSTSSNAGNKETISFTYTGFTRATYTGDEGDLVLKYLGESYQGATLNGTAFTGTPNEDKTVFTAATGAFEGDTFNKVTKTYTLGEGTYEISSESEATQATLSDTWTGANTGTYATLENGSVLIAITPETSGSYTITLDAVAAFDSKLGIYDANFNDTGFAGTPKKNSDVTGSNKAETITLDLEAGKTYYIKASAYWSDFNKAITNTNVDASHVGYDLTITVTAN